MKTRFVVATLTVLLSVPVVYGQESVESLIKILQDPDKTKSSKTAAIDKLGELKAKASPSVPVLKEFMEGKDFDLAVRAIGVLGMVGEAGVPTLAEGMKLAESKPRYVVESMVKMNASDKKLAAPAVLEYLKADYGRKYPADYPRILRIALNIVTDPKDVAPLLTDLAGLRTKLGKSVLGDGPKLEISTIAVQHLLLFKESDTRVAIPVLVKILEPVAEAEREQGDYVLHQAAMISLRLYGKEAEAALPALRTYLENKTLGKDAEKTIDGIKADTKFVVDRTNKGK